MSAHAQAAPKLKNVTFYVIAAAVGLVLIWVSTRSLQYVLGQAVLLAGLGYLIARGPTKARLALGLGVFCALSIALFYLLPAR